jgi:diguanylate cyclase (GGDEF)-like protein
MPTDTLIRVLLVEDNPGDARLVVEMLKDPGASEFHLEHVTTVRAAIARLSDEARPGIDAVLLDLSLPDEHGVDTVRRVIEACAGAVIVVMTGAGDEQMGLAALQEGAQDYLVKGQVTTAMLRRAVRFSIERGGQRLHLENLSVKDDLTGLHNRRGFLALAEQQMKLARRQRTPFVLLFLDLDRLKYINDTFGHAEGNRAIAEAAKVLRDCFRQSDIVGRLGGDEFAAMAMNTSGAHEHILRLRIGTALQLVNAGADRSYPLGFSIGLLTCQPGEDQTIEMLLERADALMYEDKGRKRRVPEDAPRS